MGTATVLSTITAAGLTVAADGDKLMVRPKDRITPELRALIRARKAELLMVLASPASGPGAAVMTDLADVSNAWEERAAICEHDAGLSRADAEALAVAEFGHHATTAPILDTTGVPAAPCPRCGGLGFWRLSLVAGEPWRCRRCVPPHPMVTTDACWIPREGWSNG